MNKSWIGLAPWAEVRRDFSELEAHRHVCYVASFGRNYQNLVDNYARGYKVKHRVYLSDWSACSVDSALICNTSYDVCAKDSIHILDDPVARYAVDIQCFTTRTKVGAICDHDRGGPLVCGGEVNGYVIRAALQTYCNDLYPLPFIIQLIRFETCWWCDFDILGRLP
uniref:Snake venom serine protease 2 n=1 Tax=Lygus hesperus TaxID=30085 RepID=A0A0A9ZFZ4_LYGHE